MRSVRDRLRAATDNIHQALHGAAPFVRIADGSMDRAGYGALLQFLHRYHTAMAPACSAGAAALAAPQLDAAHRARLEALENDLLFIGVKPLAGMPDPLRDAAFSLGCLYTVQGSTLGGKVIFRQLDALLPGGQGRRFFAGSAQDGAQWRLLCERLEEQGDAVERIEAGALHAFARFDALLAASGGAQGRELILS